MHNKSADTPAAVVWMERWRKVARRIRVPLGFVAAAVYCWRLATSAPHPLAIVGSLVLVVPGLWLRGYAAGYVKKNQELTQTGPYAWTRNPLYLGSMLMAAGFAVALADLLFTILLLAGFIVIYVPVIVSEEAFLRRTFADYDAYCRRVPRLLPRLRRPLTGITRSSQSEGRFSLDLYRKHREYRSLLGVGLLYAGLVAAYFAHLRWLR